MYTEWKVYKIYLNVPLWRREDCKTRLEFCIQGCESSVLASGLCLASWNILIKVNTNNVSKKKKSNTNKSKVAIILHNLLITKLKTWNMGTNFSTKLASSGRPTNLKNQWWQNIRVNLNSEPNKGRITHNRFSRFEMYILVEQNYKSRYQKPVSGCTKAVWPE